MARALAARWMILGEWRAHPVRAVLAATAIAVGVALGLAVHQVRAVTPAGFDEALYPRLARLPGVAAASPVIELQARAGGAQITLLGLDIFRAAAVTPSLLGQPMTAGEARGPTSEAAFDESAVFLSSAAMQAANAKLGDQIVLSAAGHAVGSHGAGPPSRRTAPRVHGRRRGAHDPHLRRAAARRAGP